MSRETKKELDRITRVIVKHFNPERLILFGSYAAGQPKEGSDFDLFIIMNTLGRQIDRARAVRKLLPRDRTKGVDLIIYNPQEFRHSLLEGDIFIEKIIREGKVLYAKRKISFAVAKKS